ncbi:MAG: MASE1 domain-containing protein [Gammaproteobacteria bacterium]|nr:MASE1 domain-containing protein [Gammaproteobacteria bacterium]
MSASNLPSNAKWQQMLAIVNQSTTTVLPDLNAQFRQLFFKRLLAENTLVFLLQYIGLVLCAFGTSETPVWLAAGTSCAFIFMRGPSVLPGIWFGTFCAYFFAHSGIALGLIAATAYALQAYFLLSLSYRFLSPTLIYYQQLLLTKFFVLASGITALMSLILTVACYKSILYPVWLYWWLANLTGVLIFSFALITLDAFFTQIDELKELNKISLAFYILTIITPLLVLISSPTPAITLSTSLLLLLNIILVSQRFGWCGCVISVFCVGFGLDLAAFLQTPLFTTAFTFQTVTNIQLLLLLATLVGLSLGIRKFSAS